MSMNTNENLNIYDGLSDLECYAFESYFNFECSLEDALDVAGISKEDFNPKSKYKYVYEVSNNRANYIREYFKGEFKGTDVLKKKLHYTSDLNLSTNDMFLELYEEVAINYFHLTLERIVKCHIAINASEGLKHDYLVSILRPHHLVNTEVTLSFLKRLSFEEIEQFYTAIERTLSLDSYDELVMNSPNKVKLHKLYETHLDYYTKKTHFRKTYLNVLKNYLFGDSAYKVEDTIGEQMTQNIKDSDCLKNRVTGNVVVFEEEKLCEVKEENNISFEEQTRKSEMDSILSEKTNKKKETKVTEETKEVLEEKGNKQVMNKNLTIMEIFKGYGDSFKSEKEMVNFFKDNYKILKSYCDSIITGLGKRYKSYFHMYFLEHHNNTYDSKDIEICQLESILSKHGFKNADLFLKFWNYTKSLSAYKSLTSMKNEIINIYPENKKLGWDGYMSKMSLDDMSLKVEGIYSSTSEIRKVYKTRYLNTYKKLVDYDEISFDRNDISRAKALYSWYFGSSAVFSDYDFENKCWKIKNNEVVEEKNDPVEEMNESVEEMIESVEEMNESVEEMNESVEEMNESVEEMNESVEEMNESVEEMNESVEEMNEAVEENNEVEEKNEVIEKMKSENECYVPLNNFDETQLRIMQDYSNGLTSSKILLSKFGMLFYVDKEERSFILQEISKYQNCKDINEVIKCMDGIVEIYKK